MMRTVPKAVELSLILCLRNSETKVTALVRNSVELATSIKFPLLESRINSAGSLARDGADRSDAPSFEILACDERSTDNTLSILSILFTQVPNLRSLQDLARGNSLMRAAHTARGRIWLIAADILEVEHGAWAIDQVLNKGKRAAMIPDELLALDHSLARDIFSWFRGELAAGQRKVAQELKRRGEMPAWRRPQHYSLRARLSHNLRGRLGPLLLPLAKKSSSTS